MNPGRPDVFAVVAFIVIAAIIVFLIVDRPDLDRPRPTNPVAGQDMIAHVATTRSPARPVPGPVADSASSPAVVADDRPSHSAGSPVHETIAVADMLGPDPSRRDVAVFGELCRMFQRRDAATLVRIIREGVPSDDDAPIPGIRTADRPGPTVDQIRDAIIATIGEDGFRDLIDVATPRDAAGNTLSGDALLMRVVTDPPPLFPFWQYRRPIR